MLHPLVLTLPFSRRMHRTGEMDRRVVSKFWACPRRARTRPFQRLLTVHRRDRIGHCAHVSHVTRRIGKRECASRAGEGLQPNKVETQRWR